MARSSTRSFAALLFALFLCGQHAVRAYDHVTAGARHFAASELAGGVTLHLGGLGDAALRGGAGAPLVTADPTSAWLSAHLSGTPALDDPDTLASSFGSGELAHLTVALAGVFASAARSDEGRDALLAHARDGFDGTNALVRGPGATDDDADVLASANDGWFWDNNDDDDDDATATALRGAVDELNDIAAARRVLEGGDDDDDAENGATAGDVVGALAYGLVNGVFLGMADLFRDAARNPDCDGVAEAAAAARRALGNAFSHTVQCAKDTLDGDRKTSAACERQSAAWRAFGEALVEASGKCATLRNTILFTLVIIVVILAAIPIAGAVVGAIGGPIGSLIGAVGGVLFKVGMILLAAVAGAAFLVKTVRKFVTSLRACIRTRGRCSREHVVNIVEAAAEFIGAWIGIIAMSGLNQVVRLPSFRALFSGARPRFEPRFLADIEKMCRAYKAAKGGAKLRPGSLPVGPAAVADDAAREAAKQTDDIARAEAKIVDDAAKAVDDVADDAAAGQAARQTDDAAEQAARDADAVARDADEVAKRADEAADEAAAGHSGTAAAAADDAAVAAADDAIAAAERKLAEAKGSLNRASEASRNWRPGPPREYKRAVHVGNGKFETQSFGTITDTNPHLNRVSSARAQHKRAAQALDDARAARAKLNRGLGPDPAPGQTVDDLKKIADQKRARTRACSGGAGMILLQGRGPACDISTMRGYEREASEAALKARLKQTYEALKQKKENIEWKVKNLKLRSEKWDAAANEGRSFKAAHADEFDALKAKVAEFKSLKKEYATMKDGKLPAEAQAAFKAASGARPAGPRFASEADEFARWQKLWKKEMADLEAEVAHLRRQVGDRSWGDAFDNLQLKVKELDTLKRNPQEPPMDYRIRPRKGYWGIDDGQAQLEIADDYLREADHQIRMYRLKREETFALPEGEYGSAMAAARDAKEKAQLALKKAKEINHEISTNTHWERQADGAAELAAKIREQAKMVQAKTDEAERFLGQVKPRPLSAQERELVSQWDEVAAQQKIVKDRIRARLLAEDDIIAARANLAKSEANLKREADLLRHAESRKNFLDRSKERGDIFSYDTHQEYRALKSKIERYEGTVDYNSKKVAEYKAKIEELEALLTVN